MGLRADDAGHDDLVSLPPRRRGFQLHLLSSQFLVRVPRDLVPPAGMRVALFQPLEATMQGAAHA